MRPNIGNAIFQQAVVAFTQTVTDLRAGLEELRNDPDVSDEEYKAQSILISKMELDLWQQTSSSVAETAVPIEGEFEKVYEALDAVVDKLDRVVVDVLLMKRQIVALSQGLPVPQDADGEGLPPTTTIPGTPTTPGTPTVPSGPTTADGTPLPDPWRGTDAEMDIVAQYVVDRVSASAAIRVQTTYAGRIGETAVQIVATAVAEGRRSVQPPNTFGGVAIQVPGSFNYYVYRVANKALTLGRNTGVFPPVR
jgi:hypothetical protein